jgi:hypothetical protein
MLFSSINIRNVLVHERKSQEKLIREANQLLERNSERDRETESRLKNPQGGNIEKEIDDENVFSINEIRNICIRYRLRFLDTAHFRSKYPYDAIAEINAFEKKHDTTIKSFRIIAPSKAFDLENINKDPLLFAELTNNRFYLLHQWGKELKWYRKIFAWPLQNFRSMIITLLICCFIFAFSIPSSAMHIFSFESEMYLRIWLTIHTFIGTLGLILWAGISFDKSFSSMNWNSKYQNY